MHLAVDLGNPLLVKALLVFEADSSLVNNEGLTAWGMAKKRVDDVGMMDFKDRQGVLYALYATGAAGATTPTGKTFITTTTLNPNI